MTEKQAKIIVAMAQNDLNMAKTSRATFYHFQNVRYHVNEIEKKTGLDPRKFYDMLKLLPEAEAVLERRKHRADW